MIPTQSVHWVHYLQTWTPWLFVFVIWALMQWHGKLPSVRSISDFANVLNSRGGNIAILAAFSWYFFKLSIYLFNALLGMVRDKTISEDNAFALMAIQFVTTTAFGGFAGAMLKTMTGESTKARSSDFPEGGPKVTLSGQIPVTPVALTSTPEPPRSEEGHQP